MLVLHVFSFDFFILWAEFELYDSFTFHVCVIEFISEVIETVRALERGPSFRFSHRVSQVEFLFLTQVNSVKTLINERSDFIDDELGRVEVHQLAACRRDLHESGDSFRIRGEGSEGSEVLWVDLWSVSQI